MIVLLRSPFLRRTGGILLFLLICFESFGAQETRVAILAAEHAEKISDVLTAKLSGEPGLVLLERDELRKVLAENELQLAQAVADPAKAGSLLGADVLLVIEGPIERDAGKSKSVSVRLVFVNRGLVLYENVLPLKPDGVEIADEFALPDLREALHKAGELREAGGNAVAIHLDRILADNGRENDLRMQLASLFSRRMQREKGWVVVERRRLFDAAFEQETRGTEPQRPVTSTHRILLGFSQEKDQLLFRAHVECAASSPVDFRFEGSREKLSELADAFAREFANAANLKADATAAAWDPLKEAESLRFRASHSRHNYQGAYEWASAAWALGLHTPKIFLIRIGALARCAEPEDDPPEARSPAETPLAVKQMLQAIDLTREYWRRYPDGVDVFNFTGADNNTLEIGGALLMRICQYRSETLFADELPALRAALKELAAEMPKRQWAKDSSWEWHWRKAVAAYSSLWDENYEQARVDIEKALNHPPLPTDRVGQELRSLCEQGPLDLIRKAEERYQCRKVGLFYPKVPGDEVKCRELEIALGQKLLRSPYIHVRYYGTLILKRLEVATAMPPPELSVQMFTVSSIKELEHRLDNIDPNDPALGEALSKLPAEEKTAFVLKLLKEGKPSVFLKRLVVEAVDNVNDFIPSAVPEILDALDDYRLRIQDATPTSEKESRIWTEYLKNLALGLTHIRNDSHAPIDYRAVRERRLHNTPQPAAEQSLIVNQFWFLDSEAHGTGRPDFTEQLVASDTHLFYTNRRKSRHATERGVWMIDRQKQAMTRIATLEEDEGGIEDRALGTKFIQTQSPQEGAFVKIRCWEAGRKEAEILLPGGGQNPDVEAVLDNELYIAAYGKWEGAPETTQRLFRWNISTNRLQMLADKGRIPPANLLDTMLQTGWPRYYSLEPDGSHGIFTIDGDRRPVDLPNGKFRSKRPQNPGRRLYRISPDEPVATITDQLKEPSAKSGGLDFIYRHSEELGQDEILLFHTLLTDRVVFHAPFRTSYPLCTARFPENVFNLTTFTTGRLRWADIPARANPYLENSVTCFIIDSMQGCIIIERNVTEELRARIWLAFFEADRITAIPLYFDISKQQLSQLVPRLERVKNAKLDSDWTPRPNTKDQAYILDDGIVITNETVDGLWFIPNADIEKARQRAR